VERPWGLSGPEFLDLYWIALAVTLGFAIFVRVRLRGARGVVPAGVLGLFDIAYLTGGPRRVAETSVAGLIAAGTLAPARNGAVRIAGSAGSAGSAVASHPVDKAVLADATRYKYRTLTLLITSVSGHDATLDIGRRLSSMDYLVARDVVKSRLRVGVVPMALLFVIGVVRWVNGLSIGAPVGWLTLQLVLTGVLVALLVKVAPSTLTASGREAVAKARAGGVTGGSGATGSVNAAELVALDGFDAHPDVSLRAAARTAPFPRSGVRAGSRRRAASGGAYAGGTYSATGGGCGSSASTCSSSSSSGSSCGGGGGGCGGGGGS
jgi:uncharacterized protein (TIGR04222 family)